MRLRQRFLQETPRRIECVLALKMRLTASWLSTASRLVVALNVSSSVSQQLVVAGPPLF